MAGAQQSCTANAGNSLTEVTRNIICVKPIVSSLVSLLQPLYHLPSQNTVIAVLRLNLLSGNKINTSACCLVHHDRNEGAAKRANGTCRDDA